jgi:hypothetical protein
LLAPPPWIYTGAVWLQTGSARGWGSKLSIRIAAGERLAVEARASGWLLPLGGLGMAILYLLFTLGYPLTNYYDTFIPVSQQTKPLFSLADRSLIQFEPWVYVVAIFGVHAIYFSIFALFLRKAWSLTLDAGRISAPLVLGVPTLCALILLWSYPLFSQDVFDYFFQTREWVVYGANPYTNTPENFRFDPFFKYASWTQAPSAYGPLWLLITAPLNLIGGDNLLLNIVLYKALAVAAFLGTAWLIYLTLGRVAPRYQLAGTVLFAWNPTMIIEFAGSGHNDVVMLFSMALAVYLVSRRAYALSLLTLVAGGLVKIVPVLLIPFFVLYIAQSLRSNTPAGARPVLVTSLRQRPRLYLTFALLGCALFAIAAYIPFWDGPAALSFLYRGDLVAGAVVFHHVLTLLLFFGTDYSFALSVVKVAAYGGLLLFALRQVWVMLVASEHTLFNWPTLQRAGDWLRKRVTDATLLHLRLLWWARETGSVSTEGRFNRLLRVCFGVLAFFTLFASLYYQPWYLTWPLLFTAYMISPQYKWHVLILTLFSAITTVGFVLV